MRYSDGEEEELHGGRGSWTIIKTLEDPEDVILVEGTPKSIREPAHVGDTVTCRVQRKTSEDASSTDSASSTTAEPPIVSVTFSHTINKWGQTVLDTFAAALDLVDATRVWVRACIDLRAGVRACGCRKNSSCHPLKSFLTCTLMLMVHTLQ